MHLFQSCQVIYDVHHYKGLRPRLEKDELLKLRGVPRMNNSGTPRFP